MIKSATFKTQVYTLGSVALILLGIGEFVINLFAH